MQFLHASQSRSCKMLQFEVNVIKKDAIILYDFVSTAFYSYTFYLQGSHSCLPRFILVFEFRNSQKIAMFLSEILQISKISLNFTKFHEISRNFINFSENRNSAEFQENGRNTRGAQRCSANRPRC